MKEASLFDNNQNKPQKEMWPTEDELLGSEKINENVTFMVVLEEGNSDQAGEREAILEVGYEKGHCFIYENGRRREAPFIEAGALIIKYNRHNFLNEQRRKLFGIDKLLAKKHS